MSAYSAPGVKPSPIDRQSKVVIIGAGPSAIHFAHRLVKAGYQNPVLLEQKFRLGGKSHTKVFDAFPGIRHEMGTCYMTMGYTPVRELLKDYYLETEEVEFGRAWVDANPNAPAHLVWDLDSKGDYERTPGKDFDDWLLLKVDEEHVMAGKEGAASAADYQEKFDELARKAEEDPQRLTLATQTIRGDDEAEARGTLKQLSKAFKEAKREDEDGRKSSDKVEASFKVLRPVARIVASLKVLLAVGKYLQKHRDIFGDYKYGLPPRGWLEDDKLKAELNMTFLEWLQANDVQALMNFFIYSQAAQGYGALDKVPAFYGLWWHAPGYIRPTFDPVNKLLNKLHTGRPFLTVMRSGFSSLWENIVAKDGLDVQLGCTVTHIDRSKGGKQTIEYTQTTLEIDLDGLVTGKQDERKTIADADLVVLTVPQKAAVEHGLYDASKEEKDIFGQLQGFTFKTTAFRADPFQPPDEVMAHPGENFLGPLQDFDGHVRAFVQSSLTVRAEQTEARPAYVAYQALTEPPEKFGGPEKTSQMLEEKFRADIGPGHVGMRNVRIEYAKVWDYFYHWPNEAIMAGAPWRLVELQGDNGIVFAGSSCCFESVIDVMAYNDMLFDMFQLEEGAPDATATVTATARK